MAINKAILTTSHGTKNGRSGTKLVGVIGSKEDARMAMAKPNLADIYEFRADKVAGIPEVETAVKFLRELGKQIILTPRDRDEGGERKEWSDEKRIEIFHRYLPLADIIDVEAAKLLLFMELIKFARKKYGVTLLASSHNLKEMPTFSKIKQMHENALNFRAEFFKLVVNLRNPKQFRKFNDEISILSPSEVTQIVPVPVGVYGKEARILYSRRGAPLVYGYLHKPVTSTGQWQVAELRRKLESAGHS